jgi:hypothetical protein
VLRVVHWLISYRFLEIGTFLKLGCKLVINRCRHRSSFLPFNSGDSPNFAADFHLESLSHKTLFLSGTCISKHIFASVRKHNHEKPNMVCRANDRILVITVLSLNIWTRLQTAAYLDALDATLTKSADVAVSSCRWSRSNNNYLLRSFVLQSINKYCSDFLGLW